MSRGAKRTIDGPSAGFTLLEALIALAVVTIVIQAIGWVAASNARGARQLESHVALVQAANDILWLELPVRTAPINSVLSGRTMDHEWRMEIQPLAEMAARSDAPASNVDWVPATVRLQVLSPSGSMVSLQTARLFDVRPKQ